MKIWVDADACPRPIKEILYRVADRRKLSVVLVANRSLHVPRSDYISTVQVARGFDVADGEIVKRLEAGDLVITADIPLAAEVIEKGGVVLEPRGEFLDADTVSERLTMRNFMDELRSSGVDTGGPPALAQKDRQAFANQLDRLLTRQKSS